MAVSSHHVVLFPYMAKGHTIPLLQFARLLLRHRRKQSTISVITVTVFTTPKNQPFVSDFLSDTPEINVFSLPFPENISGIPSGVENTEKLPSMSLFVPFTRATKLLQPFFEESLKNLPEVSFMVSDGFLWWTSESAAKFKIPRLVFYGMNSYASAVSISAFKHKLFTESPDTESDTEPITVPDFPWIRVKKCELNLDNQSGPAAELFMDQIMSITTSHGFLVNSFYELEKTFVDYNNSETPKSWCIGPLCLTDSPKPEGAKPDWIHWLDKKGEEGRPVLYVAFGTQAEISNKQLKELALGLEDSKVRTHNYRPRCNPNTIVIQIYVYSFVESFRLNCSKKPLIKVGKISVEFYPISYSFQFDQKNSDICNFTNQNKCLQIKNANF